MRSLRDRVLRVLLAKLAKEHWEGGDKEVLEQLPEGLNADVMLHMVGGLLAQVPFARAADAMCAVPAAGLPQPRRVHGYPFVVFGETF